MTAATLVLGIGNPSRGDDALGPLFIERLQALDLPDLECLTDYQLQVEHCLDLQGRAEVIFVDADASGEQPYSFARVAPVRDLSHSSHALSPAALLHTFRDLYGEPPLANVLGIRGYLFALGSSPSPLALENLAIALAFATARFETHNAGTAQVWRRIADNRN